MMGAERRAAIDIGTVTARMLVADVGDGVVREVSRFQAITHLGEGLTATGVLSAEGLERVSTAVAGFADSARALGVERTVAVATSAARDAANGNELLRRLEAIGVTPEIISGDREGYLTFLGASYGFCRERVLVVDIGGGSTELVFGSACDDVAVHTVDVELARSIDVGSRRVTELYLHSDPPTARELDLASGWIAQELRTFFSGLKVRPDEMVAVAGTATSLAAIDLVLDPYDPERIHGCRLAGPSVLDTLERLSAMTLDERRHVTGLEPDRAGVIVAGALILQSVMAYAGLSSTLVSEHDILYGMLLDLDGPSEAGR